MKNYIDLSSISNVKQSYIYTLFNIIPAVIILILGSYMDFKLNIKYTAAISLVISFVIVFKSEYNLCEKVKKGIEREIINKSSKIIEIQSMNNGKYFEETDNCYIFKINDSIVKIPKDKINISIEKTKDDKPILEHIIENYMIKPNNSKYGKYVKKSTSEINYYNLYIDKNI